MGRWRASVRRGLFIRLDNGFRCGLQGDTRWIVSRSMCGSGGRGCLRVGRGGLTSLWSGAGAARIEGAERYWQEGRQREDRFVLSRTAEARWR